MQSTHFGVMEEDNGSDSAGNWGCPALVPSEGDSHEAPSFSASLTSCSMPAQRGGAAPSRMPEPQFLTPLIPGVCRALVWTNGSQNETVTFPIPCFHSTLYLRSVVFQNQQEHSRGPFYAESGFPTLFSLVCG